MLEFFADILFKRYLTAKVRVITYSLQFAYAERLLRTGQASKAESGIAILTELAYEYQYRRQEIVDTICNYLRVKFPQNEDVAPEWRSVLQFAIRALASIPRADANGQPLNIDLRQMRIQSINLVGISLKNVSMWGCIVRDVEMPKADLENADLGGTVFEDCSLEWCNFKN